MQGLFARSSGVLFVLAGLTFLLGWLLMPDAGTNDAAHILQVVSNHRQGVWWSVIIHLFSSLLFVVAVVGLQTESRASKSKTMRVGASLVLMGAMGVCLDAFFHLVAYYLTAPGVVAQAVLEPMRLLQTQGIAFLVPLLLALVIGGGVYSAGCYHIDATSPWAKRVFILALVWIVFGGIASARLGFNRLVLVQGFLSLVTLGYCWLGYEILLRWRPQKKGEGRVEN